MNNTPIYTPLCNHILRFYFSDPLRGEFDTPLLKRQFLAAQEVLTSQTPKDREKLRSIIYPIGGKRDISDSYIGRRLRSLNYSQKDSTEFYRLLYYVNKHIALKMRYISEPSSSSVEVIANW